ncbi:MAG: hypothetical protein KF729_04075 [Sandaracinaceae bacterium]|nr:hypothetical protein [Sandaracinaceae bacterium]
MSRVAPCLPCLAVLVALGGCGDDAPAEPAPTPATEPSPPEPPEIPAPSATGAVMHGHYARASEARDALIRADVPAARGHLEWLAAHDEGRALDGALRPRLAAMQAAAGAHAEATTLTEAGQALATTLVRCGECHAAVGRRFAMERPPIPEGEDTPAHMRRHAWAAERMFEGLVIDDVEHFRAGAAALREAPLAPAALGRDQAPPAQLAALSAHVHELSAEAEQAADAEARAAIYGRFLATCAACHRLLGAGPGAPVEPTLTP